MSSRIVRQSKVRHVYADPAKAECTYQALRLSTATGDHNYIKANAKYFAVGVRGGGGPLLVLPYDKVGKIAPDAPLIAGHKGSIFDFDFNPFIDTMIATGSDDTTAKVWSFPDGGITETINEPVVDLVGHGRKVTFTLFHPTASNVLATASADYTVRLWDIEAGETRATVDGFTELIQDVKWNDDGSLLATSSKDKIVRIHDPRANTVSAECQAFEGSKCSKVCFLGATGRIATTGFTRQSKRQLKIWDTRDLSAPVKTTDIDQAAGVIMPFYDADSNLLFLAGKGDGNIRYYEIVDEEPYEHMISSYRSTKSAKGMAVVPKRAVDVSRNELVRMLKLTNDAVEPISFICPRKSDVFQPDLYPDAYAGRPALTAEQWFGGETAPAPVMSMDPSKQDASGAASGAASFAPMKTRAQLQKDLDAANARIQELEEEVARLKAS